MLWDIVHNMKKFPKNFEAINVHFFSAFDGLPDETMDLFNQKLQQMQNMFNQRILQVHNTNESLRRKIT